MEIAQAKQGDPRIVASTMFNFPGPRDSATNPFKLNRGFKFGERVKTKIAALDSTIIPRCRNNEAYYAHPAVSAHPLALLRNNATQFLQGDVTCPSTSCREWKRDIYLQRVLLSSRLTTWVRATPFPSIQCPETI
jgi:hypothetical protein